MADDHLPDTWEVYLRWRTPEGQEDERLYVVPECPDPEEAEASCIEALREEVGELTLLASATNHLTQAELDARVAARRRITRLATEGP